MRKKTHAFLKTLFACLFAVGLTAGGATLVARADGTETIAHEWTVVNQVGTDVWSSEGDTLTAIAANGYYHNNLFVTDDVNAVGNYAVSAHFEMTENPVTLEGAQTQLGIVPFYKDADNYVLFNLWWRNESWCGGNGNVLCNVTLEGKQNGKFINIYNAPGGNYVATQYSDIWVWNNANLTALKNPINVKDGWDVRVIKRVSDPAFSATASGDIIEIYVNGTACGFFTTDLTAPYRAERHKVGVAMRNANGLKVTGFTVEDEDMSVFNYPYSAYNYNPVEGTDFVATGNWAHEDGKFSVSALGDRDETPTNALTTVDEAFINYSVSADVKLTAKADGASSEAGLTVWHKDHENTLTANLVYENGVYKGRISGKINAATVWQESDVLTVSGDTATLKAEKLGSVVVLYVNGTEVCRATSLPFFENKFIGVNAQAADAEFTSILSESKEYTPYDEYLAVVNGTSYTMSSAALDDFSANENKLFVDAQAFTSYGYAVTERDTFGKTTTSVTFSASALSDGYFIGVIGYYKSRDDFYFGGFDGKNACVYRRQAGTDVLLGMAAYAYDGSEKTLSFVADTGAIELVLDGNVLVAVQEPALKPDNGRYGGFLVKGASATFSAIAFDGWRVGDAVQLGEWTAKGPALNTWSVDGEGNITGDGVTTKVERGDAYALKDIGYTSEYYVYAKITVHEFHTNWERRVAYYPWFIDWNNYIAVYASHVAGQNPEIVAEGKINGETLEMKWNAFTGILALLDTENVMEVYVGSNVIRVYNGKTNQPVWSFDAPGLGAAAEGKQVKAGVGVVDVKATVKSFTVSEMLTSTNTVAPTIELITSPTTTGTVGKTIVLPVVDVQDDLGESINRVFTVFDPEGEQVTLEGDGRFIPQKAGEYTVRITAVDSWGNQAEPYEYKVTVTEGGSGSGSETNKDKDGTKDGKGGCGSAISLLPLIASLGCAWLVRKKREN